MRRPFLALLALPLGVSCATIMHGTKQSVGLSSSPTGAEVTVDNQPMGKTPLVLPLTRKDHHTVRFTMAGYQPFEATLTRSTSGWVWGNLVFGGLVGLAVDAASGGLYKLTPEQLSAQLAQDMDRDSDCLYLLVTMSADPSWTRIGTLAPE